MIQLFPFAAWLALVTSAVLLFVLLTLGELRLRDGTVLVAWCLGAAYWQFFALSAAGAATGLAFQTLLAIYLILRLKLTV